MIEYLMIVEILKTRTEMSEEEYIPLIERKIRYEDEFVNKYKLRKQ